VPERSRVRRPAHARKLNDAVVPERDRELEYFGLRTLYDRYLLKHPGRACRFVLVALDAHGKPARVPPLGQP
jgi:ribonucleotide reductase alpha subunit